MNIIDFSLGMGLGSVLGGLVCYILIQRRREEALSPHLDLRVQLEKQISGLEVEKKSLLTRLEEHKKDIAELKQRIVLELSQAHSLALKENTDQLSQKSQRGLESLLQPFQLQLKELHEKIHRTYDTESRERLSLQEQIKMIVQTHEKMTTETASLSKALRGDSKVQGQWGELTLRRVLEMSGLQEGHEYQEQGKNLGLRDEDGILRKPDYLILLPDQRHIVIDSKVVLTAYERFYRTDVEEEKAAYRKEFSLALQRHIEDLGEKDYASLHGINTPDFTLMFLPSDGAYLLALQSDDSVLNKAFAKKVILTSPSLLLPLLRTVEFVWRQDRQGKNAEKIALSAGKLYDKFVGFIEDLERVRNQIQTSERSLDDAFSKLRDGKGNLVGRIENLRKLGAKVKKPLSTEWVEDENQIEGEV